MKIRREIVEYPCGCEFQYDDEYDVYGLTYTCPEHECFFNDEVV